MSRALTAHILTQRTESRGSTTGETSPIPRRRRKRQRSLSLDKGGTLSCPSYVLLEDSNSTTVARPQKRCAVMYCSSRLIDGFLEHWRQLGPDCVRIHEAREEPHEDHYTISSVLYSYNDIMLCRLHVFTLFNYRPNHRARALTIVWIPEHTTPDNPNAFNPIAL